jgi:hypothetical protein
MVLNKPTRAVVSYEEGLCDWPKNFRRDHGVYYSRLARAYAAAHKPEQAVVAGQAALTIGAQTKSNRILSELRRLVHSFGAWKDLPEVASFAEELRAVTAVHRTGAMRGVAT